MYTIYVIAFVKHRGVCRGRDRQVEVPNIQTISTMQLITNNQTTHNSYIITTTTNHNTTYDTCYAIYNTYILKLIQQLRGPDRQLEVPNTRTNSTISLATNN